MKRIGLRARIILIAAAFLLVSNLALGAALNRQSRRALRQQYNDRMLDVVNTAADLLDGDVLARLTAEDRDTPEYQTVLDTLGSFDRNIKLAYIYCLRDMGEKNFVFTIDPDPIDPAAFGEPIAYSDALRVFEVQQAKQAAYNLILMDRGLPGMSGIEAARALRRDSADAVILLTGYSWDDIREEARAAGVDGFLERPLFASGVIEEFERVSRRNHLSARQEKQRVDMAGRRVLLAEDMEINAEIMTDLLSLENVEAEHAENGRAAVEMFSASAPGYYDAILMDVRMPEMDGLEADAAIRIPIIALTANAFDEDVQRSMQVGMNAHLSKPVESEHLMKTLGELIYQAENG